MSTDPQLDNAISNFVNSALLTGLKVADKLDRQSDWYGAGTGAALLFLLGDREKLGIRDQELFRISIVFLAASLVAAGFVKYFGYLAGVFSISGPATEASIDKFRAELGERPLQPAMELAINELRPRVRFPGSLVFWWSAKRALKDPRFAFATIAGAVVQYMACFVAIQILCLLNAVERLALSI